MPRVVRAKKTPKNDPAIEALYEAVQKYVEAKGGALMVIGGIQIQEWPQDNPHVFHVAVKCLGRKPELLAQDHSTQGDSNA